MKKVRCLDKQVNEVNYALISHQIALEQTTIQKERVGTLQDYYNLSNLRYQDGLTDYLTFLDAERKLFDGELAYAASQAYAFTTLINIYKSLGGGWVLTEDKAIPSQKP